MRTHQAVRVGFKLHIGFVKTNITCYIQCNMTTELWLGTEIVMYDYIITRKHLHTMFYTILYNIINWASCVAARRPAHCAQPPRPRQPPLRPPLPLRLSPASQPQAAQKALTTQSAASWRATRRSRHHWRHLARRVGVACRICRQSRGVTVGP